MATAVCHLAAAAAASTAAAATRRAVPRPAAAAAAAAATRALRPRVVLGGAFAVVPRATMATKVLTTETLNEHIRTAQYAVRGELAIRAEKYKERLAKGDTSLPFTEIVHCNIGNPQQLEQKPITFFRQVAALVENPELLSDASKEADLLRLFPADAIARARLLTKSLGSVGAYSHSMGVPSIRANVAKFIEERDGGIKSNPEHIFLTAGASDAVKMVLNMLISSDKTGVLIPIPQYPLYTATLALYNGRAVPYYLDEDGQWSLSANQLRAAIKKARAEGTDVRALVVINPGNPTGQCLDEANMKEIVEVCHSERLVLLADEVYQVNVYDREQRPFHSFKKIVHSMGAKYADLELFSFHSTSKGVLGECGRRGGYVECSGIDPAVLEQMYKVASIGLCPPVQGQIMVDLMVNPPKPGEPSYALYEKETTAIYESLKRRAVKLVEGFRKMEGVTCNYSQGAMYTFPRIRLPPKAIEAAKAQGVAPDTFYALAMLDATGVCVVPGSGFGQAEGTFHFRATFLPPESKFDVFIAKLADFHAKFMDKYR